MKTSAYEWHPFPFDKVKQGDEIVIYGLGFVGEQYIAQIMRESFCTVAYAVDRNWKCRMNVSAGVPVYAPTTLKNEYRQIVLAARFESTAESMKDYLHSMGISDDQVVYDSNVCMVEIPEDQRPNRRGAYMRSQEMEQPYMEEQVEILAKIQSCMKLRKCEGRSLIRMGSSNDGGYVMLDDFAGGIAYSFGISNDVTWDAAMADKGYQIFMYDPTIAGLPYESEAFHFFKMGIADSASVMGKGYDTLAHFMTQNGHSDEKHMILKMDVEGAEYGFLEMTDSSVLAQFNQMVFEFHDVLKDPIPFLQALKKIGMTHELIHVHANNNGSVCCVDGMVFPDTYELTFANKETYISEDADDVILPIAIDAPCRKEVYEIRLGRWNQRIKDLQGMVSRIAEAGHAREKIVIYGLGHDFWEMRHWLQRRFDIIGVTDSYKRPSGDWERLYVEPTEIASVPFDQILICSTRYQKEIYHACRRLGIPDEQLSALATKVMEEGLRLLSEEKRREEKRREPVL